MEHDSLDPPEAPPEYDVPPIQPDEPIPFDFRGQGSDFFGIWIVNLLLTIITLGLYTPWARVRVRRFFHEHTYLNDKSFDYLADPRKIFRFFLLIALFFILWTVLEYSNPLIASLVWILALAAIPWLLVRFLRFVAYNSTYDGIRFRFTGTLKESYFIFLLGPIITIITLGFLLPYFIMRRHRFYARGHMIGKEPFSFDAPVKDYYNACLKTGLLFVLTMVLYLVGSAVLFPIVSAGRGPTENVLFVLFLVLGGLGYLYIISYFRVKMFNLRWGNTKFMGHSFVPTLRTPGYFKVSLINAIMIVITLGLFIPFARVRIVRLLLSHLSFSSKNAIGDIEGLRAEAESSVGEAADAIFDIGM